MLQKTCCLRKCLMTISLFVISITFSKAQDPYFSQFFLNPVYMNPAYAGTMKVPRVGVQYRNQWPGMNKAYTTYFASYDTYLPKITSGVGLLLYNDVQGNGIYTQTSFKFLYSKEIKLNNFWTMFGSLAAGAQLNALDFNRLVFADGLDPVYGNNLPTAETIPENNNRFFPDFGAGILVFSDKYFWGMSADHLAEPNQSIYPEYIYRLYRKYTMHFEVNLPWFKTGHLRKYCTFNPNIILQSQGSQQSATYGLYANRKGVSLGLWNRITTQKSSDLIVMAGFIGKQFKSAISYDYNLYGVGLQSHGSVEISISFLLKNPGKKSIFPFYEIPGEWDIK